MNTKREFLAPTDILCIVAMILTAGLYALTREPDLKTSFLGLVLFLAGRQSKKQH
jgi:hypothetical protein